MIILASNSWMKKTILEKSEFDFKAVEANVDEKSIEEKMKNDSSEKVCIALAEAKAKLISKEHPNDFVIAADTFGVLVDGTRLSKPKNHEEQVAMCLAQSGKTTTYFTGIAIIYQGKTFLDYTQSKVTYVDFNKESIEKILTHDGLVPCNGGLGFSVEVAGFTLVSNYEGSYTGAMGLPMEVIREQIKVMDYGKY